MEALKWQKREKRKRQLRRNQLRRKNKDVIILDYHKAINVNTLMAFFVLFVKLRTHFDCLAGRAAKRHIAVARLRE
ncbi:MAG: hypothetical protein ACYS9C_14365 [Planctomycetota bacterium]|jgi:hypothetical protein